MAVSPKRTGNIKINTQSRGRGPQGHRWPKARRRQIHSGS